MKNCINTDICLFREIAEQIGAVDEQRIFEFFFEEMPRFDVTPLINTLTQSIDRIV